MGVATPLVYGVCCPESAGLCAFEGEPALPGGVAPGMGLIVYGEFAYGESGCDCGPSVRTRLFGGAKADWDAAGEGLCCGGENAGCGTCGWGCAMIKDVAVGISGYERGRGSAKPAVEIAALNRP